MSATTLSGMVHDQAGTSSAAVAQLELALTRLPYERSVPKAFEEQTHFHKAVFNNRKLTRRYQAS